jgi:hypothetical protein
VTVARRLENRVLPSFQSAIRFCDWLIKQY